ncbi:hypothetical protein [Methanogenium organophilum]|uniref:Uncharacterized protein n=1 Tax=Methanogenium organophilum TaxID=2199 RepID=A0A9X9T7L3_METOG|nr:hypothetical protein [Methanogenium organophilum]WAI00222.1 hypothetical protein OU421_07195 [Methanogenium organophilum]
MKPNRSGYYSVAIFLLIFLFIFSLLSGCVGNEAKPDDRLELSEDEKEKTIRIASENATVKPYLSGEYEILDVEYSMLKRASEEEEWSKRLPAVTIKTKEAVVTAYVYPEEERVISISKLYIRDPVIMPPHTQYTATPPGGVTPTVPVPTPIDL